MTSGPCHISIMEQCEISAVASQEKEYTYMYVYISAARDSGSHYVEFQQYGRLEATF